MYTPCAAAGKSTFIKNIFASYTQDPNLKVNDVPGATSKDVFVQHPDKLQTEIVVKDERNMLAYHYRVQDTPGMCSISPTLLQQRCAIFNKISYRNLCQC